MVDQIGRATIAELLVNAGFSEFVVERVEFARVERIAQLADQIASPDQASLRVGGGMVFDKRYGRKALPDKYLPALDVIGHQKGVGGPARRRHRIAGGVNHEMVGGVAG